MSKNTFNIYGDDKRRQAYYDLIIINRGVFKSAFVIQHLQELEDYVVTQDEKMTKN